MLKMRMQLLVLIAAVAMPITVWAAPTIKVIAGDPLTLNIAADGSMQVFNSTVPGQGQIFPTGSQYGDMGVFAVIDGKLYAPHFTDHTGTATGNLGNYTPWAQGFISNVGGLGTPAQPYFVTLHLGAPGVGVALLETISYVTGLNYFRVSTQWLGDAQHNVRAFLAGDIYLASSDAGVFTFEPQLRAPGGTACSTANGNYNILLIPITPAAGYSAAVYSNIWSQIGAQQLDNQAVPGSCVDNGAALEWDDIFHDSTSATINAAVSFGEIPPPAAFQGFILSFDPPIVSVFPGTSTQVTLNVQHNSDTGFNAPITLSAPDLPPGISMTFDRTTIPAPGDGSVKATITVAADAFPAFYRGVTALGTAVVAKGTPEVHGGIISVEVICNPPFILALPTSQPQTQTVKKGSAVTLSVRNDAGGGALYQWYSGHTGFTSTPITGATSASYTTSGINDTQEFWVRVTNACGSADSQTATITPVP
ncbi:MAG: hypothetical protein JWO56_1294 [Acidobacteria bacterium]|nr:hypothetical protein [Acidobacteriota bacterium]